jgi:hypothetical protein
MRPVKVTLITKDTISIGVERAPEWGNGLLTVPSEPIHAPFGARPWQRSDRSWVNVPKDQTTRSPVDELTRPAIAGFPAALCRSDKYAPRGLQLIFMPNRDHNDIAQSTAAFVVFSNFPRDQTFHNRSEQPRPRYIKQRWQIRRPQQMSAAGAPMTAADDHPEKGCPGRGDRGGGQKETSDVGCGGPLPLANHDSISPTTFALCVETFSDRAKSLPPRTAGALRISCASPPATLPTRIILPRRTS